MKQISLLFWTLLFSVQMVIAQNPHRASYASRAEKFLSAFSPDTLLVLQFSFEDSLRERWERLPGKRMGLKLSHFNGDQKIAFHELLRSCLSTQGYLTATSIMFNEDIQQKFEPNLGRNEFWVMIFGIPGENTFWGFKLEGHHLSLNFTFMGNQMIANSPLLMSTNPANSITDSTRTGLILLYKEEEMARDLLLSLNPEQLKKAYSNRKKPDIVYSEQDKYHIRVPDEGIYYSELNEAQKEEVEQLVAEYFHMFNPGEIMPVDQFCNKKLRFFYIGSQEKGKPHYYRFENGDQIIEYENYDNHIHCFWRTNYDFGNGLTGNPRN